MANITEEHLHHMAKRHHATMTKLGAIREKVAARISGAVGTLETGAGAWLGGMIEGRTAGMAVGPVPLNLAIGAGMLVAGHLDIAGDQWSAHFNNIGNGFVGSYVAATGYAFGKRWRESGKVFGVGQGHPWTRPYEAGAGVSGNLNEAQMADIVQRMHAAAAAGQPG